MATAAPGPCVANIGAMAGIVWKVLQEDGPLSVTKLVKAVGEPHDLVMQALGWLAREGKICIKEKGRTRIVSLA